MEKTIRIIKDMLKKGVIADYAIGGAMAVTFYSEAVQTFDLDVFVFLNSPNNDLIVSLEPIYEYCRKKKYQVKQEHLMIEGVAVQFIPAYNALVTDAVSHAGVEKYGRLDTRVFTLEYLMAIMLQTRRPKDLTRLAQILSEGKFRKKVLENILKKHGLEDAWKKFKEKFSQ